ncbi:MAG: hypothetical protein Q9P90_02970 [candidate division KSB1 bacterium]|nr:hypothetical protein [candidate division KSB1 bacterium]
MMRRLAIFLLLVLAGLLGCQKQRPVQMPKHVRQMLDSVPAGVDFIAYWNHTKIKQTGLARMYVERIRQQMLRETQEKEYELIKGILQKVSISEVMIAFDLNQKQHPVGYAMFTGTIPADSFMIEIDINTRDTQFKVSRTEVNGKTVYQLQADDKKYAILYDKGQRHYFGPEAWVMGMARGESMDNPVTQDPEIRALLSEIVFGDQLWFVINQPMQLGVQELARGFSPQTQFIREAVQAVVLSAQVNDDLRFDSRIMCDTPENGKLLIDLVRGTMAAAKLSVAGERELIDEINRIKVEQRENQALIHGTLTQRFFEKAEAFGRKTHLGMLVF